MGLSQTDKVPKQKKCHCKPVRILIRNDIFFLSMLTHLSS